MHVHVPAANPFYSTRSAWIAFCVSFCPFFRPSIFFQLPPVRFLLSRSFSFLSLALVVFACVRPSRRVSSIRKSILTPERNISTRWMQIFFSLYPFLRFLSFFFFFFKLFHPLFGKFLSCFALTRRGFIGSRGLNCAGEEWNLLGSRSARLLLRVDSTSSLESFSTKCFLFFKHRRTIISELVIF